MKKEEEKGKKKGKVYHTAKCVSGPRSKLVRNRIEMSIWLREIQLAFHLLTFLLSHSNQHLKVKASHTELSYHHKISFDPTFLPLEVRDFNQR